MSTEHNIGYGLDHEDLAPELDAPQVETTAQDENQAKVGRATYLGLLAFSVIYFGRPEDWIPGIAFIPWAKISGLIALLAFLGSLLTGRKLRFSKELWVLSGLFGMFCISVPFSTWVGGSFNVVLTEFSKVVLITIVLVQAANTQFRLRRLMVVQTIAVIIVSGVSLHFNVRDMGRISGALNGGFLNPNDLAQNITLVFPFALVFFGLAKGIRKIFWFGSLGVLGYALTQTYSRGGFLSMFAAVLGCIIWGGSKIRRPLIPLVFLLVIFIVISGSGGGLVERASSIWNPAKDATGSYNARQELLTRSLELAATHPFVGIGPGQFQVLSGNWHVAHNSYTEIAAESGILAFLLFCSLLVMTFTKLRKAYKQCANDSESRLVAGGLMASLWALMISMFFASSQYQILPYFIVGYCVAFALNPTTEAVPAAPAEPDYLPWGTEKPSCVE